MSKFGDLLPLITNRVMSCGSKGRLYSGLVLYGTWPVREEDLIGLGRNNEVKVERKEDFSGRECFI